MKLLKALACVGMIVAVPSVALAGNITGTVTLSDSPSDASGVLVELFEVAQVPAFGFYGVAAILLLLSFVLFYQERKQGAAFLAIFGVATLGASLAFAATSVGTVVTGSNGTFTFPDGKINREYIIEASKLCYVPVTVNFTTDGGGNANLEIDLGHPDIATPTASPAPQALPTFGIPLSCSNSIGQCGPGTSDIDLASSLCEAYPQDSQGRAYLLPGCGLKINSQGCNFDSWDMGFGLTDNPTISPTSCQSLVMHPRPDTLPSTGGLPATTLVLSGEEVRLLHNNDSSCQGTGGYLFVRDCPGGIEGNCRIADNRASCAYPRFLDHLLTWNLRG